MSAENPPVNASTPEVASVDKNSELSPEQLREVETSLMAERAHFLESRAAEANAMEETSALKLKNIKEKLGLSPETAQAETIAEPESLDEGEPKLEPLPTNRSLVLTQAPIPESDPEVTHLEMNPSPRTQKGKSKLPTLDMELNADGVWVHRAKETLAPVPGRNEVIILKDERIPDVMPHPLEEGQTINWEEVSNHAEDHEKMRESIEELVPKEKSSAEKEANESELDKPSNKTETKPEKVKTRKEHIASVAKNGAIGIGALSTAGALGWIGYSVASSLASTPVFTGAAGLAGISGFGAVIAAGIGLWFARIAISEFFKAGGFKALFEDVGSKFGGKGGGGGGKSHAAPKKAAGGGGHGGGGSAHH